MAEENSWHVPESQYLHNTQIYPHIWEKFLPASKVKNPEPWTKEKPDEAFLCEEVEKAQSELEAFCLQIRPGKKPVPTKSVIQKHLDALNCIPEDNFFKPYDLESGDYDSGEGNSYFMPEPCVVNGLEGAWESKMNFKSFIAKAKPIKIDDPLQCERPVQEIDYPYSQSPREIHPFPDVREFFQEISLPEMVLSTEGNVKACEEYKVDEISTSGKEIANELFSSKQEVGKELVSLPETSKEVCSSNPEIEEGILASKKEIKESILSSETAKENEGDVANMKKKDVDEFAEGLISTETYSACLTNMSLECATNSETELPLTFWDIHDDDELTEEYNLGGNENELRSECVASTKSIFDDESSQVAEANMKGEKSIFESDYDRSVNEITAEGESYEKSIFDIGSDCEEEEDDVIVIENMPLSVEIIEPDSVVQMPEPHTICTGSTCSSEDLSKVTKNTKTFTSKLMEKLETFQSLQRHTAATRAFGTVKKSNFSAFHENEFFSLRGHKFVKFQKELADTILQPVQIDKPFVTPKRKIEQVETSKTPKKAAYQRDLEEDHLMPRKSFDLCHVFHVTMDEMHLKVLKMLDTFAQPLLQNLQESGALAISNDFTNLQPDVTRFILNQYLKSETLQDSSKGPGLTYCQVLALHGLVKACDSLLHCSILTTQWILKEYQNSHRKLLKSCYQPIIDALSNWKDNPHPKLVCLADNMHMWSSGGDKKVLLVLKRYKNTLSCAIQSGLQMSCITSTHDQELTQEEIFNSLGSNQILITSLSNMREGTFPWSHFSLVVEYEFDSKPMWAKVCREYKIAHWSFSSSWFGTGKQENEIDSNYPNDKVENVIVEEDPVKTSDEVQNSQFTIIVSENVSRDPDLLIGLEKKQNILVINRDYRMLKEKKTVPQLCFADMVIDERTGIVLTTISELSDGSTCAKLGSLHRKYSLCWIVIYSGNQEQNQKQFANFAREGISKLYASIESSLMIRVMRVKSVQRLTEMVRFIAEMTKSTSTVWKKEEWSDRSWMSDEASEDELKMLQIPCLNSFSAQLMLTIAPLNVLVGFTNQQLIDALPKLPKKILKAFYVAVHCDATYSSSSSPGINMRKDQVVSVPVAHNVKKDNVTWNSGLSKTEVKPIHRRKSVPGMTDHISYEKINKTWNDYVSAENIKWMKPAHEVSQEEQIYQTEPVLGSDGSDGTYDYQYEPKDSSCKEEDHLYSFLLNNTAKGNSSSNSFQLWVPEDESQNQCDENNWNQKSRSSNQLDEKKKTSQKDIGNQWKPLRL